MEILPHHENWELCRENAHPNAQKLFSEEWYWDGIDDYAPFGNDTGSDVLYFYSSEVNLPVQPQTVLTNHLGLRISGRIRRAAPWGPERGILTGAGWGA